VHAFFLISFVRSHNHTNFVHVFSDAIIRLTATVACKNHPIKVCLEEPPKNLTLQITICCNGDLHFPPLSTFPPRLLPPLPNSSASPARRLRWWPRPPPTPLLPSTPSTALRLPPTDPTAAERSSPRRRSTTPHSTPPLVPSPVCRVPVLATAALRRSLTTAIKPTPKPGTHGGDRKTQPRPTPSLPRQAGPRRTRHVPSSATDASGHIAGWPR
jgi:hypothetical protein